MRKIAGLGLFAAFFLLAEDPRQPVQVSKTEHLDFPSGGLLRLKDVIGELSIESWDQPGIEITTTKTTKAEYDGANQQGAEDLEQVRIAAERREGELVLTTTFPRYGHFLVWPGSTRFVLTTHIFAPRNTRLDIDGSGQIYIDDITGSINAHVSHGTIVLHLAERGHYDIDARSKWGNVNNDFAGEEKRGHLVGHRVEEQSEGAAQKLHMRVGYGDIVILKINEPQYPGPLKPAS